MIRAAAVACLFALPAAAQNMTPDTCRAGWQAFNEMTGQTAQMAAVKPDVTDQGWCRIDSTNAELTAKDFTSLEFRGTGIDAAVTNQGAPETLDVRIDGIDLLHGWKLPLDAQYAGPRGTLALSYVHLPDTRATQLKQLNAEFGGLGHIKVKAQGGGVDLSSLSAMQITSGGGRVTDITLQIQTTPDLKQAMLPPIAAAMGALYVDAIPDTSIDANSRDALRRFLTSGPDTGGLLRAQGHSPAGIGVLQIVGGVMPLQKSDKSAKSEDALKDAMEIMLSGVTVSAEWVAIE
ncbi:MAG: hypothetical protein AB8B82_17120 [Roseovarius sp.]